MTHEKKKSIISSKFESMDKYLHIHTTEALAESVLFARDAFSSLKLKESELNFESSSQHNLRYSLFELMKSFDI